MTIREWIFLFIAIFGAICGVVGLTCKEVAENENGRLREALLVTENRMNYFRRKSEHKAVFDFEKVNNKKEK